MKAANKVIVFTRVTVDKVPHLWPTAVFAGDKTARAFAVALMQAYKANDAKRVKELDPDCKTDGEGKLYPGAKLSMKIAPYEPELIVSDEDPFAE